MTEKQIVDLITKVIEEECCSDTVKCVDVQDCTDVVRQKANVKVFLEVKTDIRNQLWFIVLCQRIAQVLLSHLPYIFTVSDNPVSFEVKVDKPIDYVKMSIAEENYCKEDVNKLMEVNKDMRDFVVPNVVEIIHRKSNRGEFFTVVWEDDTKTTVKLREGDTSDEYVAFIFALGKKIFGDKGNARKFVREKKQNFEDRMVKKAHENAMKKKQDNFNKLMNSLEEDDFDDLENEIYSQMFVAPSMISKKLFKRNK